MNKFLQILFFVTVIKPLTFIILGLNIRGKSNLPMNGPAILAANHNSHLDTIVLMGLYPLSKVKYLRPVAAADYFMKNRFLRWFSLNIMNIIPLERKARKSKDELFAGCKEALENNKILILYPEGSRGKAGEMAELKKGIFHIKSLTRNVQVTPIIMSGLDKALPKDESLLVPFNCDVIVGEPVSKTNDSSEFMNDLKGKFQELSKLCLTK
ncbi:MAG: 1-acyl-sn-glycerol-3-phosphate acyltransferase [Lentisphaeraceae bacterium]|nr:1-acyl-sn-glycerol-3-phosphate acyltransferase [Lentisphaeraceae bacterium]